MSERYDFNYEAERGRPGRVDVFHRCLDGVHSVVDCVIESTIAYAIFSIVEIFGETRGKKSELKNMTTLK